jgi:hydroxyacylglutathione hydrolase
MNLIALPAFTDNYIWMIDDGTHALVVDPGDSAPVLSALQSQRLTLAGILVTHHHSDHVGGLKGLRAVLKGPVFGPASEDIPPPFTPLRGGDVAEVLGLRFEVIDVPGHTAGHIAYFTPAANAERPMLFCGDTLFSGGCGRLFEGTAAQMHASLSRLAALPGDTRVCCAHEYTLSNLKFAHAVEPANDNIDTYTHWCEQRRAQGSPTLPSSIAQERSINPFLRCDEPAVMQAARRHGAASDAGRDVLAALRQWKNEFR